MKPYCEQSEAELRAEYEACLAAYKRYQEMNLALDMSRGKPCTEQLDLSMPMLDTVTSEHDMLTKDGSDVRSYGQLAGIPEVKALFADMLGVQPENILVGGNSSLNMMFDCICLSMSLGVNGEKPWAQQKDVKFLCPVPGYDRHFAICELFGIQMINIPLGADGPDMDLVQKYVENDPTIKGIWCVPKYSNPTGTTYSDETVRRLAALKPAAKDFRIYWDNAYCVHDLTDTPDPLLNIFDECQKQGNDGMVVAFASTSKISFSGAGIAVMAASGNAIKELTAQRSIQTIGPNKVNQLMHVRYFKDIDGVMAHMQKHRAIIAPKFDVVIDALDQELAPLGIASYRRPNGGYFISFNSLPGCAKRIGTLCKEAGVVLTAVGATYPYGKDPEDANIRIAPTYPPVEELKTAMKVFCTAVKLASIEKLLKKENA